jgi:hypothetical protein
MAINFRKLICFFVVLVSLTACQRARLPELPAIPDQPADFPGLVFSRFASQAEVIYRIDRPASWVQVRVGRTGKLKRMGHNHILSSHAIEGLVASQGGQLRATAFLPVTEWQIDQPELRAAAGEGFESTPSDKDREGTRANLLGDRVLDVVQFPFLRAELLMDPSPKAWFTIRDRQIEVPLTVSLGFQPGRLVAEGQFSLEHSQIGLEPFSALGGALRVAETIEISFHIEAAISEARKK